MFSVSFHFQLPDKEKPEITCPNAADMVFPTIAGASYAEPEYAVTASSDNSGTAPQVAYSPSSGSQFNIGTRPVTVTATDEAGNEIQCTFDVTIEGKKLNTKDVNLNINLFTISLMVQSFL